MKKQAAIACFSRFFYNLPFLFTKAFPSQNNKLTKAQIKIIGTLALYKSAKTHSHLILGIMIHII